ncbi:DUF3263 domain-containing protein [Gordonia insulae]|uniref:DUF3263 domain-containing protein n=1 Tax=Gordonia insulae TaxID=2420509 RepID=A0A3G8JMY1_9ACTN|nr:DUF3263 domain-containing protein [Gordonia insulae]AZG45955.1 hypothetical protein D7316_02555 [Gordonia insulae]
MTSSTAPRVVLSTREAAYLLKFAHRWAKFGGPPDDEIFVEFGMSRARYQQILRALADHARSDLA